MSAAPALRTLSERLALIGSPNTGKTTLFNALTGSAARVGNYPGVTVERREGTLGGVTRDIRILDLPGTYSLAGETPDELVVARVLEGRIPGEAIPDGLVVVADATTLQRGLGLVREVLRLGFPTFMVVTMIDEAKARGGCPDLIALSRILGIRVAGVVGHRGVGRRAAPFAAAASGNLAHCRQTAARRKPRRSASPGSTTRAARSARAGSRPIPVPTASIACCFTRSSASPSSGS